ncbi:BON domain-containing protein [Krasilnikovia cinnamomea]|uniref:BON domain-containing protein n=1 Tax=Krasilnikovia cinnamomea TaxID=349313 RepID=A0A4Q7ZJV8_9ACTN|nr:BON domain-containing protein [Krasilnikovia cinnamomea]RZU51188.1 BON domain-containing protein [Krasilnikovia cinnamomea]
MSSPHAAGDPDTRIAWQIVDRLGEHPQWRHQHVTVEVQNRVLILTGTVDSPDTRDALTASARTVHGVRDVCNMLDVSGTQDQRGQFGPSGWATENYGQQFYAGA